jgi:hypothetical protein
MMAIRSKTRPGLIGLTGAALLLAGCAQTPMGPTVQVMPGAGKSFEAFLADQSTCKGYAVDQVKGQVELTNQRAVGAAVLTTVLSAALGAAVGGGWGAAGQGAGIGAAMGAANGTAIGAGMSSGDQYGIQMQYDNAYSQCMYSKGELVPGLAPPPGPPPAVAYSGPDPALVRSVQTELVRLSYLQDTPDGVQGARTRGAIQTFERANGMSADGMSSPKLLARLQGTPTGQAAASASAPSGWVAPATASGPGPTVTPVSDIVPASAGWVAPTKQ